MIERDLDLIQDIKKTKKMIERDLDLILDIKETKNKRKNLDPVQDPKKISIKNRKKINKKVNHYLEATLQLKKQTLQFKNKYKIKKKQKMNKLQLNPKTKINYFFKCKKLWDLLNLVRLKDNNMMVRKEFLKQKIKGENIDNI